MTRCIDRACIGYVVWVVVVALRDYDARDTALSRLVFVVFRDQAVAASFDKTDKRVGKARILLMHNHVFTKLIANANQLLHVDSSTLLHCH